MSENPSQPAATASQDQPGAFASDGGEDEISQKNRGQSPISDVNLLVLLRKSGSDPDLFENARLLIFGPLLAGLAAPGVAFIIPPTFTATHQTP